ncbi:hypothetical protein [Desulfosarcina ovata]|uniref:hypothetical protein n=1 Tax=Desulfosarcina ovata TaxID=83564 RepID=UPI0012D2B521|nr:hypothetical protein [Desulfosarcina ovata]
MNFDVSIIVFLFLPEMDGDHRDVGGGGRFPITVIAYQRSCGIAGRKVGELIIAERELQGNRIWMYSWWWYDQNRKPPFRFNQCQIRANVN